MAKRRRLEAPDATDLEEFGAGFAAKPPGGMGGVIAPIAQVVGETAETAETADIDDRVATVEADKWRRAVEEGRVVELLPLDRITAEHLVRDRMSYTREEMDELKASILANGVRTPIEVTPTETGWGLISGWRRLKALQALRAEGRPGCETVPAIVRAARDAETAYVAMVEENEVRSQLTPYERGRIAVVAAGQGAFAHTGAAISSLYAASSKAKRSKIRSFALVHEELGDLLTFPTELSEKAGLRLAAALRNGFAAKLREALERGDGVDAAAEWALLNPILEAHEAEMRPAPARGGRPRAARARPVREGQIELASGITIERVREEDGFSIKVRGRSVDVDLMDAVMLEIKRLLEPI